MFLARAFVFGIPVVAAGLTWWAAEQARASRISREGELVAMLPGEPPALNPFVPATEFDRQLAELIHEPLIRIGADGKLKPALAERWDWSQTITCWFLKEEQAAKAETLLKAISADRWIAWSLDSVTADHGSLTLRFSQMGGTGPEEVMREVAALEPLQAEIIRVELNELVGPYHEHFMANAVEAAQVKRAWVDGGTAIEMVVAGNAPKFIEEITNYYQAKASLEPRIQRVDRLSALREPVLEFALKEGGTWHDGSPLTAEDARETFHYVMAQPWATPNRAALRLVQKIEAIGLSKLRVSYRQQAGPAICGWVNLPILPASWLRAHPADAAGRIFTTSTPPGAGLYAITHRDLASLALAPSASAWANFHVRRLAFVSGASSFQTRLGFATGAADLFWPEAGEVAALLKDDSLAIRSMPPRSRLIVMWNTRSPLLGQAAVREALALGTDRQALLDELRHGRGRIEQGLFQPGLWFAQRIPPPRFDLEAARQKLADAGWMRDIEGIAKRPGQPLEFELLTTANNPPRQKLAAALAAQWRQLGAKVKVSAVPWEELVDRRLGQLQFDAAILGLDFETTWDQLPFWHSTQAGPGGLNFCGIADRQIDLLLEELRDEFDPDHVPAKAKELEDKVLALHPMLPLFTDMEQVAVRLTALQPGAPRDDPAPWTLADLVLHHPGSAKPAPQLKMRLPGEEAVPLPVPLPLPAMPPPPTEEKPKTKTK